MRAGWFALISAGAAQAVRAQTRRVEIVKK